MASPYFTPVRVRPINTSGMSEAGRAIGNSYAQMGSVIGQAIGTIGNAYFEDKKLERTMMAYLGSEEGQQFLLEKGYAPNEIQDMISGVKPLRSEVKKLFKDMGGVEKVRQNLREKMEFDQRTQINQAKLDEAQMSLESSRMQIEEQKLEIDKRNRQQEVLGYVLSNNGIDGYPNIERDADLIMEMGNTYPQLGVGKPSLDRFLAEQDPSLPKVEATKKYIRMFNVPFETADKMIERAETMDKRPSSGDYEASALESIQKAISIVDPEKPDTYNESATGLEGKAYRAMGLSNTDAYRLGALMKVIKSQVAFGKLQNIREQSKTGGALGSIAVAELDLLSNSLGALDPDLDAEYLLPELKRVEKHYTKVLQILKAEQMAFAQGKKEFRTEEEALAFVAEVNKTEIKSVTGNKGKAIETIKKLLSNGENIESIRQMFIQANNPEEIVDQLIQQAQAGM